MHRDRPSLHGGHRASPLGSDTAGAATSEIKVTLLGSGGGPNPIFSRVKPRLAVYAHISDADLITPARKAYAGRLEAGEDLMTIEIGEAVTVHRAK